VTRPSRCAWSIATWRPAATSSTPPIRVSFQPQYNLLIRTIEREHFALAREEGVALITWSPLASGMLTGKITRDQKPPDSRLATRDMEFYKFYFTERSHRIVDVLRPAAAEAGCTPAQLAIAGSSRSRRSPR